jgi:hypothetical protein
LWLIRRMAIATLNLTILQKRMLTKTEAAEHWGRSVKRFEIECPARCVRFANGDTRWDIRDLDAWIDSLKVGHSDGDVQAIVDRLGR